MEKDGVDVCLNIRKFKVALIEGLKLDNYNPQSPHPPLKPSTKVNSLTSSNPNHEIKDNNKRKK